MESLNITLFKAMNADGGLTGLSLFVPVALAEYLIFLVPALLILLWFRDRSESGRTQLLLAFTGAMLALGINQLVGLVYVHPRPFIMGIGHSYLSHTADSSFPSDHVTVICAVGMALVLQRSTRFAGALLLLTALPVAWARVYLGVHFPFDMIGALVTAIAAVTIVDRMSCLLTNRVCRPLLRLIGRL